MTFDRMLADIARAYGVSEDRAFDLVGAMDETELAAEHNRALAHLRGVGATPNRQRARR